MRLNRGTWAMIGWALLLFGGWAHHASAQEVPSKDVGKSTYFIPVFPGGSVNIYPYDGNFKYSLPLFKTSGVGPCMSFGLTYNVANVWNDNPTCVSLGWTCDYLMKLEPSADGGSLKFTLPWGDAVNMTTSGGSSNCNAGFGFAAQFNEATDTTLPYHWSMQVVGGKTYLFNADGTLRSILDPTGNRTDILWASAGHPSAIVDMVPPNGAFGVGRTATIQYYDSSSPFFNFMKSITDPAGNTYDFAYQATGAGIRLGSVQFPPIMINGSPQRPTYSFQHSSADPGLLFQVSTPRGTAGGYSYTIQYDNGLRCVGVTDPAESFVNEAGASGVGSAAVQISYFNNPLFAGFTEKRNNTTVTDRRNNSTVYVFNSNPFVTFSSLLSEIWDPIALSGSPDIGNDKGGVPGTFPVLAHFDSYYNMDKIRDRWGNETDYTFVAPLGPIGFWQKNLLTSVSKSEGAGMVTVEEFTYTQDLLAKVQSHTTYALAGVPRTITYEYDLFGRVTVAHLPDVTSLPGVPAQTNITTQSFYDTTGFLPLNKITDERGFSTHFMDFDPICGLPRQELRDGGTQPVQKQYDAMGNLIQTKQPQGGASNDAPDWEQLVLDTQYRLVQIIDPLHVIQTTKAYDLDGNVTSLLQAGDATTPAQATVSTFDRRGFLVGATGADGSWTQSVDAIGNIRSRTSLRGFTTTYKYDADNRLIDEIEPGASVYGLGGGGGPQMETAYAYDVGGATNDLHDEATRIGSSAGNRLTKKYFDTRHRLHELFDADGQTSARLSYDEQDHVVAKEYLFNGAVQKAEVTFRDERDRVFLFRVQPDPYSPGATPTISSDTIRIPNEVGTIVEERDPMGRRVSNGVDARERLVTVTDSLGVVVRQNVYGDDDQVIETQVPDPATKSTTLVTHQTYQYTARKELKATFNRDGIREVLQTYRVRKGVLDTVTDALNVVTQTTYVANTWHVDEVVVAQGTADERRTKSVWTNGLLAEMHVWNPAGSPAGGYATSSIYKYFYDQGDRLERYEYPGGILAAEQTLYSEFSEVSRTVAGTRTDDVTCDALGRITASLWNGPASESVTRTYNELGDLTFLSTTNVPRSESTDYLKWLGTPNTKTFAISGVPWRGSAPTLTFAYDLSKKLTALIDKEGGQHAWAYDANGRLQSTSFAPSGQASQLVASVRYTPGGLLDATAFYDASGNPIAVSTVTYDGRGRRIRQQTVQSANQAVVADLQWAYDDRSLVTAITFNHLGVVTTLGYNARQEVISESTTSNNGGSTPPPYTNAIGSPAPGAESAPAGPVTATPSGRLAIAARNATYAIDPAGNRTSQTIDGVTTTFTYNVASQLLNELRVSSQSDSLSHAYDPWGNEITRTTDLGNDGTIDVTEQYQYNYLNRLAVYTNSATSANWQYDFWPSGDRCAKTNLTGATPTAEFYIPKMGDVVADYLQVGGGPITLENKYVQGVSTDSKEMRIAGNGDRRHYVGDGVGTLSVTLDDTGGVQQSSFKDVFGIQLAGSTDQERYSGIAQRERDTESGLDFVRARMYDPRIGRFTQMDSILANRPTEHYLYADNDPVTKIDPLGLAPGDLWDPRTWVQVAKDTAYYAFADEHNTLRAAFVRERDHLERVADRAAAVNGNPWVGGGLAVFTVLADSTGGTDAYEAATGEDLETFVATGNMRKLNTEQRVHRGISAVTKVAGTALAVGSMTGRITPEDLPTRIQIGGSNGLRVVTIQPGAAGKMTATEVQETQQIVDEYDSTVDVGGSRASGFGRNIENPELPPGKGPGTRSDIDFRSDTSHPQSEEMIEALKKVGDGAGSAGPKWSTAKRPTTPPYIRFKPGGGGGCEFVDKVTFRGPVPPVDLKDTKDLGK